MQKHELNIQINSEIGPLKKVLVHTPGKEIECMAPQDIDAYLFHAIIFEKDLRKDYHTFKNVLKKVATVYEIKDCLADILEDIHVRDECLDKILNFYGNHEYKKSLLQLDSPTLAKSIIEGLKAEHPVSDSFASHINPDHYILRPLPNLYFARDTSVVVGNRVISANMAFPVRYVETILTHAIFTHHPDFSHDGFLLDASNHHLNKQNFTLEGGDIHVWHDDLYLIGISARTNPNAVDAFIDALVATRKQQKNSTPFHVVCVFLPKTPSMIHLDMVFTRISENQALAYAPAIIGDNSFRTIKISINHKAEKKIEETGNLLQTLKTIGYSIEPVFCAGNQSLIQQQREQWVSGTNTFALAPGKIISYENEYTLVALEKSGFKIVAGEDFIQHDLNQSAENLVITIKGNQLSQGGGGPRCMTCPILRE